MKKPLNKFSTTYESFSRESRRGTQECVRHIVLTISLRQATISDYVSMSIGNERRG